MSDKSSLIEGAVKLQPVVIVMDLSYAAGDLSGLTRELRDHAPAAKLLLLSVHDETTVVAAAIAARMPCKSWTARSPWRREMDDPQSNSVFLRKRS